MPFLSTTKATPRSPTKPHPLHPLPRLYASNEQNRTRKHNRPLPPNPLVLEDIPIDDGDIQHGENGEEARHDGPEQKRIPPHIPRPLRKIPLAPRPHTEKGAPHIHHFPGEEKAKPRQADKRGRPRAEDGVAAGAVAVVAVHADGAVAEAEEHKREGGEAEARHPEPVGEGVDGDFAREDPRAVVGGGPPHDVLGGGFDAEAHVRRAGGDHDDPEDLDGADGEDGEAVCVLEGEADKQRAGEGDVLGEQVRDELLDVVEHAAALFDGVQDAGEVVVGEDDVAGVLCHVAAVLAHGDADVGALQRGRVVDAVARHGREAVAAVQRFDHADFCRGGAARDDEREAWERVDLGVAEFVELRCGHHHARGDVGGHVGGVGGEDPDLRGNGARCAGMVACEHVHGDASRMAFGHGAGRFGSWGIVEADEAAEDEPFFDLRALSAVVRVGDDAGVGLTCKREDAEALRCQCFHVFENLFAAHVGHRGGPVVSVPVDEGARSDDSFNGTFGEDSLLL